MLQKTNQNSDSAYLLVFNIVTLLIANILTIVFFVLGDHSLMQILLTYYVQTILIVVFYFLRIKTINQLHVARSLPGFHHLLQKHVALSITAKHEFIYLLVFASPIAFLLFVFATSVQSYALNFESVNYTFVVINSVVFLLHHFISYVITVKEYRKGNTAKIDIPYIKLFVRVFTIYAITLLGIEIFDPAQADKVFIIFVIIKTLVDIVFSSSWFTYNRYKLSRPILRQF